MNEHIKVLEELLKNPNIGSVDESSSIDVLIIQDLIDRGLIDAIDACSKSGLCFLNPRINLSGREWLKAKLSDKSKKVPQQTEDIIEVKPNFIGVGLNLNALWRKIRGNKT